MSSWVSTLTPPHPLMIQTCPSRCDTTLDSPLHRHADDLLVVAREHAPARERRVPPDHVAAVIALRRGNDLRPAQLPVPLRRQDRDDQVPGIREHDESLRVRDEERGAELTEPQAARFTPRFSTRRSARPGS